MKYVFMWVMGFEDIISKIFATPRKDSFRKHSDNSMLLQLLYQVFAAYFTDDCGYRPLLCFNRHIHGLIQLQTRNIYSSDGTVDFLQPVLNEYRTEYKDICRNNVPFVFVDLLQHQFMQFPAFYFLRGT